VAKCVVCGKSAGPFYSLHKSCLSDYQNTRKSLKDALSECVASSESSRDIVTKIQSCKPSAHFSEAHFKQLFLKAWQEQASVIIKNSTLNPVATNKLLHLAEKFNLNKEDVDEHLLTRLYNVEYLDRLQKKLPLKKNFQQVPEELELGQQEFVIWAFEDIAKTEPLRYSQEKQWTVFNSVLNNILMKKRYKQLAEDIEESGTLYVTDLGLYYKNQKTLSRTKFSEIHSITPMKNGVRIQASQSGAMPDTYITGDGRFTYTLLQYAQGLNN
jgi:hypothetical protein